MLCAEARSPTANLKKGKFLPWMKTLRFVIAAGAIMQVAPVAGLPTSAVFFIRKPLAFPFGEGGPRSGG